MPITPEHVGRTYPPAPPYEVSRAKIAEFAGALLDENPAYAGASPVAPPTFAAVIAAQAWGPFFDDPELGLELKRTMHADQRFVWDRPLREGDDVVATLGISKVRTRGATDMVTIDVDMVTPQGEHLCRATSQLIHTRPEGDQA